jgi:hypothetical protein
VLVDGGDFLFGGGPAGGIFAQVFFDVLVDGGVHEHRQDHRRGAVDGHGDGGAGRAEVEAGVELLHVVERGDVDAGVADLAVDVRARRRVFAVEGDRVERGGQARGRAALAEVMKAAVGALGRAFAGEHARRVFAAAAVRIHAAGVRVMAGQIFAAEKAHEFAPVFRFGRRDFRNFLVAERLAIVVDADDLVAHGVLVELDGHGFEQRRPCTQLFDRLLAEFAERGVVALAQGEQAAVDRLAVVADMRQQIRGVVEVERVRQLAVAEFFQ